MQPSSALTMSETVFAQPQLAADQAMAAALQSERQHLGSQLVRLRPLPGLPAELPAALRRRYAGADGLADELALELRDARDDGRQHAPCGAERSKAKPLIAISDTRCAFSAGLTLNGTVAPALPSTFSPVRGFSAVRLGVSGP